MTGDIARAPAGGRGEASSVADRWRVLWVSLALFIAALGVRLLAAQQQPVWTDELYHVLAGSSLHNGHGLQIYEGVYERDPMFTWIVSNLAPYFTWNLFVPRLPAVVAGALLVAIVFAWLRFRSDWIAALAAAIFLCLSEIAVQQSAYVRFYSIHGLFFWLAAISAYDLFSAPGLGRRIGIGATGAVSALIALHLQPITIFGLAAIAVWGGWAYFRSGAVSKRTNAILLWGLGLAAVVAILVGLLRPDVMVRAVWEFTHSEQWNKKLSRDVLYYVKYMILQYPLMISGFGVAAVLAYRERPSLTVLCLCIVLISGTALSVAGMKSPRYFLFAMPFVFTVCGLGLSAGWRLLVRSLPAGQAGQGRARRWFWPALVGFSMVAALIVSPGFVVTIASSLGGLKRAVAARSFLFAAPADEPWQSQRAKVAAALSGRSVILTTEEFRTLRYFGAYDIAIVPSYGDEIGKKEFVLDKRTGRPHISTLRNIEFVYSCYPTGALMLSSDQWPATGDLDPDIQTFLDQHARHQVFSVKDVPEQLHLLTWEHPAASPTPACAALMRRIGQGHRPASETIARVVAEPGGGRIARRG